MPFEYASYGKFSSRVLTQNGYWGYWIEKNYRETIGSDCYEAQACDVMNGIQTTSTPVSFWNEEE